MPVFNNALAGAAGSGGDAGYKIERSLRIDDISNATLTRTPSAAGNRKTWTLSFWIKRTEIGGNQLLFNAGNTSNGDHSVMRINSDMFQMYQYGHGGDTTAWSGGNGSQLRLDAVFRDPSAWMHIVVAMDTTQATQSDRLKYYINGVLQTEFDSTSYPVQDSNPGYWNAADLHCWGGQVQNTSPSGSSDYYLAEVHMVDGQQLAASDFGEFDAANNVWQPKAYSGTYGTNGFHLDFSDNSSNAALGTDSSGNNNDWTVNNLTAQSVTGPSTGSSWFFDGSSSLYANDSSLALGTGDWTVEYFLLPWNNYSAQSTHIGYNGNAPFFETDGATKVRWMGGAVYGSSLAYPNWYHIAYVSDGGQGAMWVNGTRIATNLTVGNNFTQTELRIGQREDETVGTRGLLSNVHIVVGTAKYKRSQATIPIPHTPIPVIADTKLLALSTNTLTEDASGNNITLTAPSSGISVSNPPDIGESIYQDSFIDTPTNYEADSGNNGGNYATWNPLVQSSSTFSNGNLQITTSGGSGYPLDMANFYTPAGTGKWYWEFELDALSGANYTMVGMLPGDSGYQQGASDTPHLHGGISVYVGYNGDVNAASGAATAGTGTATFGVGDILGWAFDAENGTLQCYKNNVSQGTQFTNIRTDIGWVFCVTDYDNSATATYVINFGQRPFAYTPPSGYKSLCTTNLPDPTIADGSTAFEAKLWTGNGTSQTITTNLSPDFAWIKKRGGSGIARGHCLQDIVRGAGKTLESHTTAAEYSDVNAVTAFNSDGFSIGSEDRVNENNGTYVGWIWDAGTSNTSISAGGLNSSVYDQSQTWTNQVSGTENSTYPFSNIFNADNMATHAYPANGTEAVFTPSPSFSSATTVTIWYYAPTLHANAFKLNGTGVGNSLSTTSGTNTHTFDVTGTGFTSLSWSKGVYGSEDTGLLRIDVDGKQLVDNGVSVTNVPSSASTCRTNQTAGFSIVSYAPGGNAQTIGHNLNQKPEMIIVKNREHSYDWYVYHKDLDPSIPQNKYLKLNDTSAVSDSADAWNDTAPTSSVFSVKGGSTAYQNADHIAYCFTSVEGYSAFGSFIGSSSLPFVYCGFRPALIMVKDATTTGWFHVHDTARDPYNVSGARLFWGDSLNEQENDSAYGFDILSNGFKLRNTHSESNDSGQTYIYAAWAEHPFKTARAR